MAEIDDKRGPGLKFSPPLQVYLLQVPIIRRVEAYLEDKFGEEYLAYTRSVRRWL